jgi:hypothetical protein
VFNRYVDQTAGRVRDMGGDPDAVRADPNGDPDGKIRGKGDGGGYGSEKDERCHCCHACCGCCSRGCSCRPHACGCHEDRRRDGDVRGDLGELTERALRTLRELGGSEYEALLRWWRRGTDC